MRKYLLTACITALLVTLTLPMAGCNRVTKESVWRDPTPELSGMSRTKDQRHTQRARARDTILRQFNDDLDALFFEDRPLRLSEYPVP